MPKPMPEKEILRSFSWLDNALVSLLAIMIIGTLSRILISKEPLDIRRMLGELGIACIGAVGLYAAGILNSMTLPEVILVGVGASMGWLRMFEWAIKVAQAVKQIRP